MSKTLKTEQEYLARTFRVASSVTDEAIFSFFSSLDTPVSLACWILYRSKEYLQLANKGIVPSHYNCGKAYRDDYQAICFLSKADFLPLEVSKQDAAKAKFLEFEGACKSTNDRFRFPLSDPLTSSQNSSLLNATRRKIEGILGSFNANEWVDSAYWGPGNTTSLRGQYVSVENKFQSETGITRDLHDFVAPWFSKAYPSWSAHLQSIGGFTAVIGNSIITVPKNSKTDRVIAVEPALNLWFQKGIGRMISRRISRMGSDLRTEVAEANQQLSRIGSLTGQLSTVDFSSASDSISSTIVRELLPPSWFTIMDLCRCKLGISDGSTLRWNKFSSMGNGFTFELETLIFHAAASAVADLVDSQFCEDRVISVFGDDVVLNTRYYDTFSSFCEFLGFVVNKKKSFSSSYFRESCGAHWFDGLDCKPFYLKKRISNVQTVYKLANGIRSLAHRRNSYYGCDRRFRYLWRHLFRRVPESLRFKIPFGYGDSGFIVNFDEATPVLAKYGYEGYYTKCLNEVGISLPFEGTGLLLARVSRGSDQEKNNTSSLRGRTKLRVSRLLVPQWYDLGNWI